ncbi:hypothetical protein HDU77_000699 [Chytriomyces hyalinus]|nr:hypothetical protein HDU77_000699 [Chytriomyces hyalinus]
MSHLSVSAPQAPAHTRNCSPICAVSLESVGAEHLDELKRVNEAIFPIKYNDSFYNSVLINRAFSLLALDSSNRPLKCMGAICCRRERNGQPVSIPADDYAPGLDYLYIMTIGVLGQYRKSGIGSALLMALIGRATADQTVAHIQLHVQISNENALSFYLKHNFRIVSQVRDYYVFNKGVIPPHAFLLRKNVKEGLNTPADEFCPTCRSRISEHLNYLACYPVPTASVFVPPYPQGVFKSSVSFLPQLKSEINTQYQPSAVQFEHGKDQTSLPYHFNNSC